MIKTNRLVWIIYRELPNMSCWCRHKLRKTLIWDWYCWTAEVPFKFKMHVFKIFITAVCVIFLVKLRWPNTKSLYDTRTNSEISENQEQRTKVKEFVNKSILQRIPKFSKLHRYIMKVRKFTIIEIHV